MPRCLVLSVAPWMLVLMAAPLTGQETETAKDSATPKAATGKSKAVSAKNPSAKTSSAKNSSAKAKWEVLYQGRPRKGVTPLPEKGPIAALTDLRLEGAKNNDPFHLGSFASNGDFGVADGYLQRISGTSSAVRLATDVENFELEASINAESLGGWFWLIGWSDGHGYALFNGAAKVSGSPWRVAEYRGNKVIEETNEEFNRLEWKGVLPLRMAVNDRKLEMQVGDAKLARDLALENYHSGSIILGTYETPYGPRNLRVQALRIRRLLSIE